MDSRLAEEGRGTAKVEKSNPLKKKKKKVGAVAFFNAVCRTQLAIANPTRDRNGDILRNVEKYKEKEKT